MEEDLSKYEFNRFILDEEEEYQNDIEEDDWVLTEALVEEETPDKENSNETSEEIKMNLELDNKEGEKTHPETTDVPMPKDKSVWNKMSPKFHRTLSDIFSQRNAKTRKTISENNQGERIGKQLSTPLENMQNNQYHHADADTFCVNGMATSREQQQQQQQSGLPATESEIQVLNEIDGERYPHPSVIQQTQQKQKIDQILDHQKKELEDLVLKHQLALNNLLQCHARAIYKAKSENFEC